MPRSNPPADTPEEQASPPENGAGLSAAGQPEPVVPEEPPTPEELLAAQQAEAQAAKDALAAAQAAHDADLERQAAEALAAERALLDSARPHAQAAVLGLAAALRPFVKDGYQAAAEDALIRLGDAASFGHDYPSAVAYALMQVSGVLREARAAHIAEVQAKLDAEAAEWTAQEEAGRARRVDPFAEARARGVRDPRTPQV